MTKEADIVAKIHTELKRKLPRAVYLKLNDLSTTGIPDLEITYAGRTLHTEVKYLRLSETAKEFRKHFLGKRSLQLATCRLLEQQGRCQYFVAHEAGTALLIRPHQLAYSLDKGTDSYAGLWTVAYFRGSLPEAIDRLIWLARQP